MGTKGSPKLILSLCKADFQGPSWPLVRLQGWTFTSWQKTLACCSTSLNLNDLICKMGMSPSLQGHCETREYTQRGLGPKEAQAGNYLREFRPQTKLWGRKCYNFTLHRLQILMILLDDLIIEHLKEFFWGVWRDSSNINVFVIQS